MSGMWVDRTRSARYGDTTSPVRPAVPRTPPWVHIAQVPPLTSTSGTQGLIFVIDSNDRERMDEARTELARIIQDREMKDALLLVFANKQDIGGALKPKDVSDMLQLDRIARNHTWKVEPSCATTGEGVFEGLAWLSSHVKSK